MANSDMVKLTVHEAYPRDVGSGIARIDMDTMKRLGTVSGDIIEIIGRGVSSYASVWAVYPGEEGRKLILMDDNTRAITNVDIDDRVKVKKVFASPAESITIAPMQEMRIAGDEQYILKHLEGMPLSVGSMIRVELLGSPIQFIVTSTIPDEVVISDVRTELRIEAQPSSQGIEKPEPVSYDDIGGLRYELARLRRTGRDTIIVPGTV